MEVLILRAAIMYLPFVEQLYPAWNLDHTFEDVGSILFHLGLRILS